MSAVTDSRGILVGKKRKREKSQSRGDDIAEPNSKHFTILRKYKSAVGQDLDDALNEIRGVDQNISGEVSIDKRQDSRKQIHQEMNETIAAGLVPLPQPAVREKKVLAPIKDQWMVEPLYVKPTLSKPFKQLKLSERMIKNLAAMGFEKSFAVQAAVIPALMSDIFEISPDQKQPILVNAATGSGKTLAYGVPIVEALSSRVVPQIRALIILPTRPLMQQVRDVIETLAKGTSLRIMSLRSERAFGDEQALL